MAANPTIPRTVVSAIDLRARRIWPSRRPTPVSRPEPTTGRSGSGTSRTGSPARRPRRTSDRQDDRRRSLAPPQPTSAAAAAARSSKRDRLAFFFSHDGQACQQDCREGKEHSAEVRPPYCRHDSGQEGDARAESKPDGELTEVRRPEFAWVHTDCVSVRVLGGFRVASRNRVVVALPRRHQENTTVRSTAAVTPQPTTAAAAPAPSTPTTQRWNHQQAVGRESECTQHHAACSSGRVRCSLRHRSGSGDPFPGKAEPMV